MRNMLSLITLDVIEQIFDAKKDCKISSMTKSLYINCLIKHLKNKDSSDKNAMSFDMFISEIPNYAKWEPNFVELHHAKIVSISLNRISFNNMWGQLIDRSLLHKEQTYVINSKKTPEIFQKDLQENQSLIDLIGMKQRMTKNQIFNMIELFIKEQMAISTVYMDAGECAKHFIYWVPNNIAKVSLVGETVKSKGKILGL